MTRAKLLAAWLLVLVGGFALSVEWASRNYRLLLSDGEGEGYSVLAEASTRYLAMLPLALLVLVPISLLGFPGRIALKRVLRNHEGSGEAVAVGVWNARLREGGSLEERVFSGFRAIGTVLLADEAGLALTSGLSGRKRTWSASWDSVTDVRVEVKRDGAGSRFGPTLLIQTSERTESMSLYVVSGRFPWFSASNGATVHEVALRIQTLWKAHTQ